MLYVVVVELPLEAVLHALYTMRRGECEMVA
jgi:hypothetical protein